MKFSHEEADIKNNITFCGFLPHDTHWSDRIIYVTEHRGKTWVLRQWVHELACLMEREPNHKYRGNGPLGKWGATWTTLDEMESIDAKAAALARDTRDVPV